MNSTFETRIEKLVYGGDGLAHQDGSTVFVPYVLPGERIRVETIEKKKKFVRGRAEEILEASAERVTAPCPRFGVCGGCHYQHIPYEAQLRYKTVILRETLARIGRIEWTDEIRTHASPAFGYRNRAQWAIRLTGTSSRSAIGYFQPASSTLAATDVCPILAPQLEQTLGALAAAFAEEKLPKNIRAIECFAGLPEEKLMLNIAVTKGGLSGAKLAERLRDIVPNVQSLLMQVEDAENFELVGPGYIYYVAAGFRYRVGQLSFFQVNRFLIDELVRDVTTSEPTADDAKRSLAIDLYAGVGLFSVPLAKQFDRVIAVEGNVATARDLEANLKESATARARHGDTQSFLARCKETPELIVMDPPRAGVPAAAVEELRKIGPAQINYLSCDPATLARDLAQLTSEAGGRTRYQINTITLYDIFPQTYHIEALVKLQRLG
jgi:23S rRNA (uracil1939-C5)-methyltransferase